MQIFIMVDSRDFTKNYHNIHLVPQTGFTVQRANMAAVSYNAVIDININCNSSSFLLIFFTCF